MEVLTEEELAGRVDFLRPLKPAPEEPRTPWCIPFEYGGNPKGTRISIPKAKQIAAELRASIAEAELRDMRRYFDEEKARGDRLASEYSKASDEASMLRGEVAALKKRRRSPRAKEK